MAAGAAEAGKEAADEFAGVLGVSEVAHRHDQLIVDHARDHRPFDRFELEKEIGDVGDEVLARRGADERAEHLVGERAAAIGLEHVFEPLHRDFRPLHLADHGRVRQRIEVRERLEIDAVGLAVEEQRV